MSTALRIRFRLSLSLSLSRVHISFGFLFFGCNYIYFWGSPAFPSFRLDATAFFTRFFLIYFWLAPVFFFGNPALSILLPHRYPAPRFCVSDAYAGTGSGYLEIRGAGWPGESGLLMRALMEYAHTHPADPRTRTHA